MGEQYKKIGLERQARIAIITINRPEVRNAVDPETVDESVKECALKGLGTNPEDAMRLDEYLLVRLLHTEDIQEGLRHSSRSESLYSRESNRPS